MDYDKLILLASNTSSVEEFSKILEKASEIAVRLASLSRDSKYGDNVDDEIDTEIGGLIVQWSKLNTYLN